MKLNQGGDRRNRHISEHAAFVAAEDPSGKLVAIGATAEVFATGTLTSDTTNVADGAPLVVGSVTYRIIDTIAAVNDILRGANAAATLTNIKAAINGSGTAGTTYFTGTLPNPDVVAGTLTSTTLVLTAKNPGVEGNRVVSTGTTHLTFGAATLTLGTDAALLVSGSGTGGSLATTAAANTSTTAATMTQALKTVAATGTPEALGSGLVESVLIKAKKTRSTANATNVYVGFSATNDAQLHELAPDDQITLTAPAGKKIDLAAIFIDVATNGDGVIYTAVD